MQEKQSSQSKEQLTLRRRGVGLLLGAVPGVGCIWAGMTMGGVDGAALSMGGYVACVATGSTLGYYAEPGKRFLNDVKSALKRQQN